MRGILLAAPSSSSGKTCLTASILRAFKNDKPLAVKVGPDYIDSQFLSLAVGGACLNIDLWAMQNRTAESLLANESNKFTIAEGVMGLFDGSKDGKGSSADVAKLFGWAVVLVVDVTGQGESIAAIIKGMRDFRKDIHIAGVIFNRLRSKSHKDFLQAVMKKHHADLPILGWVEDMPELQFESRHLGLKQALEASAKINKQLNDASKKIKKQIKLSALKKLATGKAIKSKTAKILPQINAKHIAIAKDEAFSFLYHHHLQAWKKQGVKISFFSPLKDEVPNKHADMIFLCGGYPELHAKRIARAKNFMRAMREASKNKIIYGECGGYMVMGDSITDFDGTQHKMLGFFRLRTSFAPATRVLGYRKAVLLGDCFADRGTQIMGHEFHHAKIVACKYGKGDVPLWQAEDSNGKSLGKLGHRRGKLCGSFLHIISA